MKVKLSIIIFTVILSIFYFQIVSCKSPNEPVYSSYTGIVAPSIYMPSIFDKIEHPYIKFIVKKDLEEYSIMVQSDIDKLYKYITNEDNIFKTITIKATYSNNFQGHRTGAVNTVGESWDKYLFDISIISAGNPTIEKSGLLTEINGYYVLKEEKTDEIYKLVGDMDIVNSSLSYFSSYLNKNVIVSGEEFSIEENIKTIFVKNITLATTVE